MNSCQQSPPRLTDMHRTSAWSLLGWVPAIAVFAALFFFNPAHYTFYPRCQFHALTGLDCPGCGGLRAVHQLLHGHLAEAFRLNALFVLSLPVLAWLFARWTLRKLKRQPARLAPSAPWFWCALVATVGFGIVRNLPFAQIAWLAP
jgi:hypothetical protein